MGQYTQGTGSTLDFDLVSIDSYEQPTGSTLDFELLEATLISLDESMGMNAVYSRDADYLRNYTASMAFNDADIRQLDKLLQESVVLNDFSSKSTSRSLEEAFTLDDFYSRSADYFRSYSEGFSLSGFSEIFAVVRLDESLVLNDSDIRQTEKFLTEGVGLNSVYSRTGSFFRSYTENFTLNDFLQAIIIRSLNVSETLGLNDTTEILTVVRLDEVMSLNETYSRVGDFFRSYSEGISLNEDLGFVAKINLEDTLTLATFAPITTVVRLNEVFSLNDVATKTVGKVVDEAFSLNDSIRERNVFAVRTERLALNDADIRELQRTLLESFGLNDVYNRTGTFFRDYSDDFVLDDTDIKYVIKVLETETLGINEVSTFTIQKVLSEQLDFAEVFISDADYFRSYQEEFEIAEVKDFERDFFRTFDETLAFDEVFAKQKTIFRRIEETLEFSDEFNQFFSEGPGTPPYYLRNSVSQANSLQNAFKQLNNIGVNFGSRDQT